MMKRTKYLLKCAEKYAFLEYIDQRMHYALHVYM